LDRRFTRPLLARVHANYLPFLRSNQLLPGFVDDMDGALLVSPHLDDAVFSCGDWLAAHPGSLVVTVFAGAPHGLLRPTPWDAASGFTDARQAVAARRSEDRAALATLAAGAIWLDFLDSQYQDSPSLDALREALDGMLERTSPGIVLFPAGLFHSDHALVHEAMLAPCRAQPQRRWIMYEDALYRRGAGCLQRRLAALLAAGFAATPIAAPAAAAGPKRAALACYRSQLRALGQPADLVAPEGYWRLERMP
jgi:LmbE family N-acetylglucosaminyl deacetylase